MRKTNAWQSYEVLDAGSFKKVERYNDFIIQRPEKTAFWKSHQNFNKFDAVYEEKWAIFNKKLKEQVIEYKDMKFLVDFKDSQQTGIFPEQAINWDWMRKVMKTKENKELRILNLFAYTGGATVACAMENVEEIVHIDALKSANEWAKKNIELNNLEDKKIRFIVEDVMKFLEREIRRGRTYHGIIMDPPSFGRGPKGQKWTIEDQLPKLINKAIELLDEDALFLSINTYTTDLNPKKVQSLLSDQLSQHGLPLNIHSDEIGLIIKSTGNTLPCGVSTRWCSDKNSL